MAIEDDILALLTIVEDKIDLIITTVVTNAAEADIAADIIALKVAVDEINARLPADPADESALEAAITTAEGNIRGTDSDTLKTLSTQLDGVEAGGGADASWDAVLTDHNVAGSTGALFNKIKLSFGL